jgi:hypothetical protein
MLHIEIDTHNRIAIFTPDEKLSEADFKNAARVVNTYLEECQHLNGLIISTKSFPGWDSFSALISHLYFVKDHHKKISRIALVTDSALASMAEHVASHFVSAQIKHFKYADFNDAKKWIIENSTK